MKIFVTGATGFIGSYFTEKALNNGHEVIALKRSNKSKTVIKLTKQPKWLVKDLSEIVENDLKDISVVVHFAAHSANVPYDKMENCIKNNVIYPLNLVEKAINAIFAALSMISIHIKITITFFLIKKPNAPRLNKIPLKMICKKYSFF